MSAESPTPLDESTPDRLDKLTEFRMAGLYTAVGDVDSWAAIALRKRIRELVEEARMSAFDQGMSHAAVIECHDPTCSCARSHAPRIET